MNEDLFKGCDVLFLKLGFEDLGLKLTKLEII